MEKSLKDLKVGDYVKCLRNIRKFVAGDLYEVQESSKGYLKITTGMTHEAYDKMDHTIYLVAPFGGLCSIKGEPLKKYFEYHSSIYETNLKLHVAPSNKEEETDMNKFKVGDKVVLDGDRWSCFKNKPFYTVTEATSDGRIRLLDDDMDDYFWDDSEFKFYEVPVTEGVEMAKHLREVLDDMSRHYDGNHEKTMVGFAGYLAGIIKGAEL